MEEEEWRGSVAPVGICRRVRERRERSKQSYLHSIIPFKHHCSTARRYFLIFHRSVHDLAICLEVTMRRCQNPVAGGNGFFGMKQPRLCVHRVAAHVRKEEAIGHLLPPFLISIRLIKRSFWTSNHKSSGGPCGRTCIWLKNKPE